jgi:hypothetical protein
MDKIFLSYWIFTGILLIGFLYYMRICISMSRRNRITETYLRQSLYEKESEILYIDDHVIPRTLLSHRRIIQDQCYLIKTMLSDLSFAKNNPEAVDNIATSYANAKAYMAWLLETCHQKHVDQSYLNKLHQQAGDDLQDCDKELVQLYEVLGREMFVALFYFDRETKKKVKRVI